MSLYNIYFLITFKEYNLQSVSVSFIYVRIVEGQWFMDPVQRTRGPDFTGLSEG